MIRLTPFKFAFLYGASWEKLSHWENRILLHLMAVLLWFWKQLIWKDWAMGQIKDSVDTEWQMEVQKVQQQWPSYLLHYLHQSQSKSSKNMWQQSEFKYSDFLNTCCKLDCACSWKSSISPSLLLLEFPALSAQNPNNSNKCRERGMTPFKGNISYLTNNIPRRFGPASTESLYFRLFWYLDQIFVITATGRPCTAWKNRTLV